MLRTNGDPHLTVFVIWEPVLATDWGRPRASVTSMIADPRALHFWDQDNKLSALYGGGEKLDTMALSLKAGFAMNDVLWDAALVYPPGARWGTPAKVLVAPVVEYRDDIAAALHP